MLHAASLHTASLDFQPLHNSSDLAPITTLIILLQVNDGVFELPCRDPAAEHDVDFAV